MSGPNDRLSSIFSKSSHSADPSMEGKSDFVSLFQEKKDGPVSAVFVEYSKKNGNVVGEQKLYDADELVDKKRRESINPDKTNREFNTRQIDQAINRIGNFTVDELIAKVVPESPRSPQSILPPGYAPPSP